MSSVVVNDVAESQILQIKKICKRIHPLVVIQCTAYNHEPYIRDALQGFIMQKTDFPFVAIVHDDASTDKTAEIIREYAEKYPNIILPIYETENQYSKKDAGVGPIMKLACKASGAKYIAWCEGDDYWTHPKKLQKQIDFLEAHADYSMCVSNVMNLSNREYSASQWNIDKDRTLKSREIIMNGGLFLASCSLVFRSSYFYGMPDITKYLHVGDYPLQIYMAFRGKVQQLAENLCVYRIAAQGSWTENIKKKIYDYTFISELIKRELHLLDVMDEVTCYKYHAVFKNRKVIYQYSFYYLLKSKYCIKLFLSAPTIILKYTSIKNIIFSFLPQRFKRYYISKKYDVNK